MRIPVFPCTCAGVFVHLRQTGRRRPDSGRRSGLGYPLNSPEPSRHRRHLGPRPVQRADRVHQHQDPTPHPHCIRVPFARRPYRPRDTLPRWAASRPSGPELTHRSVRRASFLWATQRYADREALVYSGQRYTYRELEAEVVRCARAHCCETFRRGRGGAIPIKRELIRWSETLHPQDSIITYVINKLTEPDPQQTTRQHLSVTSGLGFLLHRSARFQTMERSSGTRLLPDLNRGTRHSDLTCREQPDRKIWRIQ